MPSQAAAMAGCAHFFGSFDSLLPTQLLSNKNQKTMANMKSIEYQKRVTSWQRSIACRTEAYLEEAVSHATASSKILKIQPQRPYPKFHRNEIRVGELLGQGAFSEVLKVKRKTDGKLFALKKVDLN